MKHVVLRLTDEEFELLEKYRNGIPKQVYCKKKIFSEPLNGPDFVNEQLMDIEEPDFYFNVHFKLSPKERDMLDELKGNMTLQDFCRMAVLNAKIIRLDELQKLTYHISKIGNNVNQIAKVANQTKCIDNATIDDLVKSIAEMNKKIISTKEEIIKKVI